MDISEWWAKLAPSTQAWLIANNGDGVPAEIVAEITTAGGSVSGETLSDRDIDWIEAAANDELP